MKGFLLLLHLLSKGLLLIFIGSDLALLPCELTSDLLDLYDQLASLLVGFLAELLNLSGKTLLTLVQRVFGFSKVSLEGFDLLLAHGVLMFELSDVLRSLTFLVGSLILDHLDVLLVALLLFADLLLIVFNGSVVTFLSTLTLFLETTLKSISLNLKESLKLIKLFFRFLLHFSKRLLKLTGLVLKLVLELLVS